MMIPITGESVSMLTYIGIGAAAVLIAALVVVLVKIKGK
jgi:LPXTG-motif cell wall-anchored protein